MCPKKQGKKVKKLKVPADSPTEFEFADTAADTQRRREKREQWERREAETQQREEREREEAVRQDSPKENISEMEKTSR